MKILLRGDWRLNEGPYNVVRHLIEHSDNTLMYIKNKNKVMKKLETIYKLFSADVIVFSGGLPQKLSYIVTKSNKKFIHLMHGCLEYENEINHLNCDPMDLISEQNSLKLCNRIVCVSEMYSNWVKHRYPEYKDKITYVNNGVEIDIRPKKEKIPYSIAVTGGNREIKNNKEICLAAKKLNEKGIPCKVYVFGRLYDKNEDLSQLPYVQMVGQLNKDEYYQKLDRISLLVMNSEVESFGLAAADALNCNCSLLMSKNVGAQTIMSVQDEDIIENMHDIQYLEHKIQYIFNNQNHDRLVNSINIENCSYKSSYIKLKKICQNLCENSYD